MQLGNITYMPTKDPQRQRENHRRWYLHGCNEGEVQIYALLDDDGQPRYVGKSVSATSRTKTHWSQRFRRSTPVSDWLKTLTDMPEVVILQIVPAGQGDDVERYWVGRFGDLLNVQFTGRAKGHPQSAATRAKLSKAMTGRYVGRPRPLASKLTADDVRQIRASTERQRELADKYGVTQPTISQIRSGKLWGHLP
jgi:hypothetical protein